MKMDLKIKQKQALRNKVIIMGSCTILAIGFFIILNSQIFNSFKTKAATEIDFETTNEYWVVQAVSANFKTTIDIEIASKYNGQLLVKLFSNDDKLLLKESIKLDKGSNTRHLNNVGALPTGKYRLEISGEDKTVIKKISKSI